MSELKIYKASAGSGKTFTLTLEYLKLVIKNYYKYKHVLAVTFTNKAASEMKSRILNSLYLLSNDFETPFKEILLHDLSYDEKQLKSKSAIALSNILHDYSRFSVMTIDSFFQKVISNFLKEIGLQAAYKLELNADNVLDLSIEMLINKIESDHQLKKWLVDFANSKIADGKSWNIRTDIKNLSYQLLNEKLKSFENNVLNKASDYNYIIKYQTVLNEIIKTFEAKNIEFSKKAFELLSKHNLSIDDFPGKSRSFINYFNKISRQDFIPTDKAIEAVDNQDVWFKNKDPKKELIIAVFHGGLNEILKSCIYFYNNEYQNYISADIILKNLYTLGLLNEININLKEINKKNNIFLISDSAFLLKEIIANNDTPFIYEKMGSIYKHIMIDEFQDTSGLQWDNLYPLVKNSLSENNNSLVVGDIKQSIYRWRNSNRKLLSNKIYSDLQEYKIETKSLSYNRRSKENIIKFNNLFFENSLLIVQDNFNSSFEENFTHEKEKYKDEFFNVFSDYIQQIPENKNDGGFVKNLILNSENDVLENLKLDIKELLNKGFRKADIAILVRNKKEGTEIASYLTSLSEEEFGNKLNIISDEALSVSSSNSVSLLVNLLNHFISPDEIIYKYLVLVNYYRVKGLNINDLFVTKLKTIDDFISFLPEEFKHNYKSLLNSGIDDLFEKLIFIFELYEQKSELAYIISFQNYVVKFINDEGNNSLKFIEWWNDKGKNMPIQLNSEADAIRVLTIHKSKGLEFSAVIIPYCNWKLDADTKQNNILWLRPEIEPFNGLDLVPVKYNDDLKLSIFNSDFFLEKFQYYIDNLNLLYVALTRAVDSLIIYSFNSSNDKLSTVSDLIEKTLNTIAINNALNIEKVEQNNQISYIINKEFIKTNEYKVENKSIKFSYNDKLIDISEAIKIRHTKFINSEINGINSIMSGNLLHKIFSRVIVIDDFEIELKKALSSGYILKSEYKDLINKLEIQLNNIIIKNWFLPDNKIFNERNIIIGKNNIKRPDRVIVNGENVICIDYKFGNEEDSKYNNQVEKYLILLKNMGYKNIEGYLWYFNLGKIENIKF